MHVYANDASGSTRMHMMMSTNTNTNTSVSVSPVAPAGPQASSAAPGPRPVLMMMTRLGSGPGPGSSCSAGLGLGLVGGNAPASASATAGPGHQTHIQMQVGCPPPSLFNTHIPHHNHPFFVDLESRADGFAFFVSIFLLLSSIPLSPLFLESLLPVPPRLASPRPSTS